MAKVPTNRWEAKHTVVNACNGKLLSKRKGQPTGKHDVDESRKHYAEPKQPDTNESILHDSIYTKF